MALPLIAGLVAAGSVLAFGATVHSKTVAKHTRQTIVDVISLLGRESLERNREIVAELKAIQSDIDSRSGFALFSLKKNHNYGYRVASLVGDLKVNAIELITITTAMAANPLFKVGEQD